MHLSHCIFWLILPATVPAADPVTAKPPAHPVAAAAGPAIRQSTPSAFSEQTFQRFVSMYEKGIAEKLYLQLDKPYYSAGENIWFKGYLVNAVTLAPMRQSRYIYAPKHLPQTSSILLSAGSGFPSTHRT